MVSSLYHPSQLGHTESYGFGVTWNHLCCSQAQMMSSQEFSQPCFCWWDNCNTVLPRLAVVPGGHGIVWLTTPPISHIWMDSLASDPELVVLKKCNMLGSLFNTFCSLSACSPRAGSAPLPGLSSITVCPSRAGSAPSFRSRLSWAFSCNVFFNSRLSLVFSADSEVLHHQSPNRNGMPAGCSCCVCLLGHFMYSFWGRSFLSLILIFTCKTMRKKDLCLIVSPHKLLFTVGKK